MKKVFSDHWEFRLGVIMKHIFSVLVVGWFNTYVPAQKVLWHQGGPWLLQNTLYQKAKFIKITGSIKLTIIETGECLGGHLTLKKSLYSSLLGC